MKKTKYLVYLICLLVISINPFGRVEAATKISPILIYDEDELLEITIEDAEKYHGDIAVCLTIAFRTTQLAISQLWKDEIPKRGDFNITSALPTQGSKDAFEFITRVITREKGANFKLKIPKGADIKNISKDNFTFTFVRKSTNEQIKIRVREGVFPEGFFELRKKVKLNLPTPATQVEKRTFKQTKQRLRNRLLYLLPANKIFEIQE